MEQERALSRENLAAAAVVAAAATAAATGLQAAVGSDVAALAAEVGGAGRGGGSAVRGSGVGLGVRAGGVGGGNNGTVLAAEGGISARNSVVSAGAGAAAVGAGANAGAGELRELRLARAAAEERADGLAAELAAARARYQQVPTKNTRTHARTNERPGQPTTGIGGRCGVGKVWSVLVLMAVSHFAFRCSGRA
jgi:hypothetical protein